MQRPGNVGANNEIPKHQKRNSIIKSWQNQFGSGTLPSKKHKRKQEQEKFSTGAVRDSRRAKGRYDLLPWSVLQLLAERFEEGAVRYGERNWEKGQPLSRYLDSCLRHLFQHLEGRTDEKHSVAALWNLMAFVWTEESIKEKLLPNTLDDLKRKSPSQKIRGK
jgi:hypothetical protein